MAIFTKKFSDPNEYEEWISKATGRVNVLSIGNPPTVFGSSSMPQPGGPVIVKYQTTDKAFKPGRTMSGKAVEYAIVGAAFFALFAYVISEL